MQPLRAAALLAAACCWTTLRCAAFPAYDPPLTAAPTPETSTAHAAPAAAGAECTVELIRHAALDGYNQIVREPWRGVPPECPGGQRGERWRHIVLRFQGEVEGVQFDRFGGLWFAGVPLLRTTTPEPATGVRGGGTTWAIEKDISDYASLFTAAPASANTSLTIPNVVTNTYTGIQYIRVTATFHSAPPAVSDEALPPPPTVLPLLDPTANPWGITGLTNASHPLRRPLALASAQAGRVKRAWLDIVLSNHGGSEEFWYTTESAYREVNVFIDGCLAAAFFPALVVCAPRHPPSPLASCRWLTGGLCAQTRAASARCSGGRWSRWRRSTSRRTG